MNLTPVFTSITPSTIAQNTSASYAIVGDRLTASQVLQGLPTGVTAGAFTITDAQHATVMIAATATATIGAASIKIHDATNGDSGTQSLTVTAGTPSGTARTALYPLTTAAAGAPTGTKSTTLPLTPGYGAGGWQLLGPNNNVSGSNPFVQTTGGAVSQSAYWGGWVSDPLSAQTIPAGTYTLKIGGYAEGGSVYKFAPVVYVYRPSAGAVIGVIRDSATGIGSAFTAVGTTGGKVITFSLGAGFDIQTGDRLVLEVYAVGVGSDFVHMNYNGATTITEGGPTSADGKAELDFPSAIYTAPQPMGIIRVGPTGLSSGTGAITAVTVANDGELRSKAIPTGAGSLWDAAQTGKKGTAASGFIAASSCIFVDLVTVDGTVQFTDRDAVVRNTFHILIKPAGGAPVSAANDRLGTSSSTPHLQYILPLGRSMHSWYTRRLYRFKNGFRLDCPSNPTTTGPGFNSGGTDPVTGVNYPTSQSGAYKNGPHPSNASTRADLEITGGQNFGSEYLTYNFGATCTVDQNITVGAMSTLMPSWNTAQDIWEIIRVTRVLTPTTARQAMYIGKLTDATLVKVGEATRTLDTAYSTVWPEMTTINLLGENFNRQLASTDATPELWVSDTEWADLEESGFTWPSQIAVGDRI